MIFSEALGSGSSAFASHNNLLSSKKCALNPAYDPVACTVPGINIPGNTREKTPLGTKFLQNSRPILFCKLGACGGYGTYTDKGGSGNISSRPLHR